MQNTASPNTARPFGARDKIGYLLGNVANDFTFTLAGVFLLVFYTKVLEVPSAVVGTMFLIARFLDAFTDVTMGRIADVTRAGKNGKFRPWLLKMSAPVALASFLMYQSSIAGAPMSLKITYMFVTYLLWGSIFYTSINIPYGSMASLISGEAEHRASLSAMRSVGSLIANLFVGVLVPIFVYGSDESGAETVRAGAFPYVAAVFSVLALALYLACYYLTTERVQIPVKRERVKLSTTLYALVTNRALIGIVLASIAVLAAQLLTQAINQYLFIDYFKDRNGIIIMTVIGMLPALLLAPAAVPITKRFGKKEIGVFGALSAAACFFLLFLMRTRSMWVYIGVSLIGYLGFGAFNLVMWAFITDIIDDREVRTGHRDDGTVYAVYSFARKIGQAIAGGLGGYTLAIIGFDESSAVQTESVANGIYTVSTAIPAVLYLIVALCLIFIYPLSKEKVNANINALKNKQKESESNA